MKKAITKHNAENEKLAASLSETLSTGAQDTQKVTSKLTEKGENAAAEKQKRKRKRRWQSGRLKMAVRKRCKGNGRMYRGRCIPPTKPTNGFEGLKLMTKAKKNVSVKVNEPVCKNYTWNSPEIPRIGDHGRFVTL